MPNRSQMKTTSPYAIAGLDRAEDNISVLCPPIGRTAFSPFYPRSSLRQNRAFFPRYGEEFPPRGTKRKIEFAHRLCYIDVCIGSSRARPPRPSLSDTMATPAVLSQNAPFALCALCVKPSPITRSPARPFAIRKSSTLWPNTRPAGARVQQPSKRPSSLILPIHHSSFIIPHSPTQHPVARRPIPLELRLAQIPNATRTSAVVINLKRRL